MSLHQTKLSPNICPNSQLWGDPWLAQNGTGVCSCPFWLMAHVGMCVSIRDSHRCAPRGLVVHANYLSIYRSRRGQSARRTHDHPAFHETRSAARESRLISFNLQYRESATEGRHFGISRMPQLMCPRKCDQCVELHPPDRFCQFRAAKADSCKSNWLYDG